MLLSPCLEATFGSVTTFVDTTAEVVPSQPRWPIYCRGVAAAVPPDQLVGAHEIAERLGLSHAQSVHTLRKRHADFPQPVATLKTALIWDWSDVEAWAKATGRLGDRGAR